MSANTPPQANNPTIRTSAGANTSLGFGYRLRHKHFLFDTGLGVGYAYIHNSLEDLTTVSDMQDEDGEWFHANHYYTQRKDNKQVVALQIPVLLGGEWNKLYALAGVKLSANIYGASTLNGLYTLTGEYDRFIDPFEQMPTHNFVTDQPYTTERTALESTFDIRLAAEFGGRLTDRESDDNIYRTGPRTDVYLAAFAEYSVYHSAQTNPLVIGLKLTMLWNLPKKHSCLCLTD